MSPLQRQIVSIPFKGGVDTKTDPYQVPLGKLLVLENGTFIAPGKQKKRNGVTTMNGNSGDSQDLKAIGAYANELLEFYTSSAQRWATADSSFSHQAVGGHYSTYVTQTAVVRDTYQQTGQDMARSSTGLQFHVWEDSRGGARYLVKDETTGAIVVAPAILSNATSIKPRVVCQGSFFFVFWFDTSVTTFYGATYSTSTGAVSTAATSIASGITAAQANHDACVVTGTAGGDFVYYVYTDGSANTLIKSFQSSLTVAHSATFAEVSNVITVFGDTTAKAPVLAYYNGADVKWKAYAYDLSGTLGTGTTETIANVVSLTGCIYNQPNLAGTFIVWYSLSAAATYNYRNKVGQVVGYANFVGQDTVRGSAVCGKAFFDSGIGATGRVFVPLIYQSPLQPTCFLFATTGGGIINSQALPVGGKLLYSLSGGIPARTDGKGSAMLTSTVNVSTGKWTMDLLAKDLLTTQSGQVYTQTGVENVTVEWANAMNSFIRTEAGQNLLVSGGDLGMYDGNAYVEHGFHLYPEPVTGAAQGGGTGSLSAGSYQGVACYEWVDNQGQTHRSAPSVAVSKTTVGTDSIIWTIPTLRITAKHAASPVTVVFYRTIANGTIFFQDSSVTSPVLNDITADTVTFTSTQSDTAIIGNPLLYTTGGVVANYAPNPTNCLFRHGNRVWALDSTNPLQWWYTKEIIPPSVGTNQPPAEFSNQLLFNVDPRGGACTAGGSLDDKAILFKANHVFAVQGRGPDSTGGQSDFTDAQLVTTDVGCTNPRSVVQTPEGLMFQSQKGIYLLDRSLQAIYIGADVEAYNSFTVTAAVLLASKNQVRFTLSSGNTLVYDYFVGQWSVFNGSHSNVVDAVLWGSIYVLLRSDTNSYILQESTSGFQDWVSGAAAFISMKAVTPWIQMAQLQGFQRARRADILGTYVSNHTLNVSVAFDFSASATQTNAITVTGAQTPYQWRVHLAQQKCEAVQFTIWDTQGAGSIAEAYSLSGLALEIGVKPGIYRLPATKSVG